jgi:proteic killer suppression protein
MAVGVNQVTRVTWGVFLDRQLGRIPEVIARKFRIWVALVEESGLRETRKYKGFHDEPLKGKRQGDRSVRLNKAYRAIYRERRNGDVELIEVLEVNKHDYR